MGQILGFDILHGSHDAIADVGIELFELGDEVLHLCAAALLLEWACLRLALVATEQSVTRDIAFVNQTQRTDHLNRHLLHLQEWRDSAKTALENEIHQQRLDDIILMMPQCYLIASKLLCRIE